MSLQLFAPVPSNNGRDAVVPHALAVVLPFARSTQYFTSLAPLGAIIPVHEIVTVVPVTALGTDTPVGAESVVTLLAPAPLPDVDQNPQAKVPTMSAPITQVANTEARGKVGRRRVMP